MASTRSDNPRNVPKSDAKFVANGVVNSDVRNPKPNSEAIPTTGEINSGAVPLEATNATVNEAHKVIATLVKVIQNGRTKSGRCNCVELTWFYTLSPRFCRTLRLLLIGAMRRKLEVKTQKKHQKTRQKLAFHEPPPGIPGFVCDYEQYRKKKQLQPKGAEGV